MTGADTNPMDEAATERLVTARRDGAIDDAVARSQLQKVVEAVREDTTTDDHAVTWNSHSWIDAEPSAKTPPWSDDVRDRLDALRERFGPHEGRSSLRMIKRSDIFDLRGEPLDLFLATMAWGFGRTGYGRYRTAGILRHAGEDRVRRAVEIIASRSAEGAEVVSKAWSRGGEARLPGLGTAFASKVAYFVGYDRATHRGPLIADLNTSWAYWAFAGVPRSINHISLYPGYVHWVEEEADEINCRSDDVERALFSVGPAIRKADKECKTAHLPRR